MSRSRKKTPVVKDQERASHQNKKTASRRFRRKSKDRLHHNDPDSMPLKSKEVTNPYDVHDSIYRCNLTDHLKWRKEWNIRYPKDAMTEKEAIFEYEKWYINK